MSSMDVRAFERDVFFNFSTVSYYSKLKVTEKVQKEFVVLTQKTCVYENSLYVLTTHSGILLKNTLKKKGREEKSS